RSSGGRSTTRGRYRLSALDLRQPPGQVRYPAGLSAQVDQLAVGRYQGAYAETAGKGLVRLLMVILAMHRQHMAWPQPFIQLAQILLWRVPGGMNRCHVVVDDMHALGLQALADAAESLLIARYHPRGEHHAIPWLQGKLRMVAGGQSTQDGGR